VVSPWTTNGQLRLGKGSIGKDSLSKDKLEKDNIGKDNITNGLMTEEQLLQAVYLEKIKDRNANNIIECVSYLKHLPIELIKIALEQTSLQSIPEWKYTKEILDKWIENGVNNISDIKQNFNL
jgi:DnaD/phage-associated family protein